eukprot:1346080-Amorphochlora_amoeboformis.AAC.1
MAGGIRNGLLSSALVVAAIMLIGLSFNNVKLSTGQAPSLRISRISRCIGKGMSPGRSYHGGRRLNSLIGRAEAT